MAGCLPDLNRRWQAETGEPLQIGVGISTGPARVGNIGSRHKFKYGPQGSTVNLASRVQGATRYFKTRILLTADTQSRLDDTFAARRLGSVRVQGIAAPVGIHELPGPERADWDRARAEYEQALAEFEGKRFGSAARSLAAWRQQPAGAADGPALVLLARVVNCMVETPEPFDPVWILPGK
jgi:adenylate cyclase